MKYSLLIVDDEVHIARGIRASLDWDLLGIGEVLEAQSANQARQIFGTRTVDILLCDIEMPQENGLELLSWVGRAHPHTVSILLTCHADFHYAKQAVKLGSLDYLLKPAEDGELKQAMVKAVAHLAKSKAALHYKAIYEHYYQRWQSHEPSINELYWRRLLASGDNGIYALPLEEAGSGLATRNNRFLPIYIQLRNWERPFSFPERQTMEFAMRDTAERMLSAAGHLSQVVSLEEGGLLAIAAGDGEADAEPEKWREACHQYIEACSQYFYCELNCCIGEYVPAEGIRQAFERLKAMEKANAHPPGRVLGLSDDPPAVPAAVRTSAVSQPIIERMKRCIAEQLDQHVSREQLGEAAGLNPDYASKLFKKETGMSVTDYTAKLRVDMAQQMLTKTEMPISAIAVSVGFSNFSYFAKVFKKWMDRSPQDFRKEQLSGRSS
ncbi:response regulator [Paenibacillus hodogayensis]|uniref:Response regulator n=1 Tax=Paenibacillus hodogayensis TaxID=279208 RepID=A0ABV5W496_9BACL